MQKNKQVGKIVIVLSFLVGVLLAGSIGYFLRSSNLIQLKKQNQPSEINYPPKNTHVSFEKTHLPIVFVDTERKQISHQDYIPARMTIIDNGMGRPNYIDTLAHKNQKKDFAGHIAIKHRGNTSFSLSPKKPYNIQLYNGPYKNGGKKHEKSILGMKSAKKWAIISPYLDKTLFRDVLTYQLMRPYMEYVPQGKHCELVIDSIYYGIHIIMELPLLSSIDDKEPDEDNKDITGGYVLYLDRYQKNAYLSPFDRHGNLSPDLADESRVCIEYKDPKYTKLSEKQKGYISSRIQQMEEAFATIDNTGSNNDYQNHIDVLSFIDYQLITEFTHNVDGYWKSTYLYKHRDKEDRRFKLSLWDFDGAFGNIDWGTEKWTVSTSNWVYERKNGEIPFWWNRLMQDPNYKTRLTQRWRQLRAGNLSDERINGLVDSLAQNLVTNDAIERDRKCWPLKYPKSTYQDEIIYIKDWMGRRLEWMDNQLMIRE